MEFVGKEVRVRQFRVAGSISTLSGWFEVTADKEIAEHTGFEHVEYLCVVFKRLMDEPPGCYRKRMQVALHD